jgi:hypothetical protein
MHFGLALVLIFNCMIISAINMKKKKNCENPNKKNLSQSVRMSIRSNKYNVSSNN